MVSTGFLVLWGGMTWWTFGLADFSNSTKASWPGEIFHGEIHGEDIEKIHGEDIEKIHGEDMG